MLQDEVARLRKENREYKKYLKQLSDTVVIYISKLDALLGKDGPESARVLGLDRAEVGRRIAALRNGLEMQNDVVRRYGLGYSWKKDDAEKAKLCITTPEYQEPGNAKSTSTEKK